MAETTEEKYLTVEQCAEFLGTSRDWILQHVRSGALASFKLSGHRNTRIPKSSFDNFILTLRNKSQK